MHTIDGTMMTEEMIKEMLNREYKIYFSKGKFKDDNPIDIYDK